MVEILLLLIKVIFIIVIYLFIFGVIRLIYLDIKSMNISKTNTMGFHPYFKLINQRDMLGFKVEENYTLDRSVTIGRQDKNDIVIKDPFISEIHAHVSVEGDMVYIKDLKSKNGVFVNGSRVDGDQRVLLQDGDIIKIGQVKFLFVAAGK
ncbi:MAG TPA: FHA domain-containing protein [Acetivibrio sp.]|nr:FHA domain-containing protein [Clostridium sp.]HOQ36671.1 FHA domain-containing protein [Acetivibrio sp.]HPT90844.1 FHA domain-containing protein [Acetivibrio sp.]HQA59665.1 FHA domain-containing protein [Tepidanaerobacteraceae bacterium]